MLLFLRKEFVLRKIEDILNFVYIGTVFSFIHFKRKSTPETNSKHYSECEKHKNLISFFPFQFPVSSVTWGHNDKRLFCATGNEI